MGERADALRPYDAAGDAHARATNLDWDRAASDIRPADEGDDPERIREGIEQTRVEMSGTIDAIQERLNPERIKEQVSDAVQERVEAVKENIHDATIGRAERMVSNVGETARETGSGFMETIKRNPVPAALAAVGLGWLWMNRQSGGSRDSGQYRSFSGGRGTYTYGQNPPYGYGTTYTESAYRAGSPYPSSETYRVGEHGSGSGGDQSLTDKVGDVAGQTKEKVSDVAGQTKEKVGDVAGQAQERVGQFADQAQEKMGQFTDQAQYGARRVKGRFDETLTDNPLALGAVAIAAGIAVGVSLPETPWEDRVMGEARDTVMQKAQGAAQETFEKVQQVAQQVQEPAKQAVQQVKESATQEAQKQGLVGNGQNQPPQTAQSSQGGQTPPKRQDGQGQTAASPGAMSGAAGQQNRKGTQPTAQ